jgi:hypothetical protein
MFDNMYIKQDKITKKLYYTKIIILFMIKPKLS